MKKLFILTIILFIIAGVSYSQDTIRIKHTNYTTVYSKSLHYPVLVEWWETTAKNCNNPIARKDQFGPDPLLKTETDLQKDYVSINQAHKVKGLKGVDRGHMSPAASNECSGDKVLTECFYFSNMAAQYHSLNAGDWKSLETLTRSISKQKDSIHVWAGSIGSAEKVGSTTIPTKCWKVIYIIKDDKWEAYEFDNTADKPTGLNSHKIDMAEITKLTGFKFK
jgi:endonuclease G